MKLKTPTLRYSITPGKMICLALFFLLFSCGNNGFTDYIHDHEGILSRDQVENLDEELAEHHRKTGNELVFVTTTDFEKSENIEDFAKMYGDRIGVGGSEKKGVVFVVSESRNEMFILTGKGVVHSLNDDKVREIIHLTIMPHFKQGEYYNGIRYGILRIIRVLENRETEFI